MKFLQQNIAENEIPVPGVRAQICVTDYDRDGLLDLIVGDYSDINWTRELSEKEVNEFDELKRKQERLGKVIQELQEVVYGKDSKGMESSLKTKKEAEYQQTIADYREIEERKKEFFVESRRASFIWFYSRKSNQKEQSFVSQKKLGAFYRFRSAWNFTSSKEVQNLDRFSTIADVEFDTRKLESSLFQNYSASIAAGCWFVLKVSNARFSSSKFKDLIFATFSNLVSLSGSRRLN